MITINGSVNSAKVFTDNIDNETSKQVKTLCDQPFASESQIRIMPDCHAGKGCTIGTTMTIHGKVVPNLVGVDIGCGMLTIKLNTGLPITEKALERLDYVIRTFVPSGFAVHQKPGVFSNRVGLEHLYCNGHVNTERAILSVGTLGGGNHFIEIDVDQNGDNYLVIHTGSRNLGKMVADYYQALAIGYHKCNYEDQKAKTLRELKANKQFSLIDTELGKIQKPPIDELCYLENGLFNDYIHDMMICQDYAKWNRKAIGEIIVNAMGWGIQEHFTTIHNYIDIESMILRKGAVSANQGEKLLIPLNMRDGSIIAIGKGNEDWNFSAPHGAGRIMARGVARMMLTMDEYEDSMKGIFTTCVDPHTLDESPMAYKPMNEIIECVKDTVDIVDIIKPIYNFKAAE